MAKVEVFTSTGRGASHDEWLGRLAEYLRGERARSVLCIVPTGEAAQRLEERLLFDCAVPGLFGGPIRTFYRLAADIARETRLGGRDLSDLQRSLLLQAIAEQAEAPTLARVQHFPGFAAALGDLIGEIKLAMIHPPELRAAMERLPRSESALRAKLGDLLTLYQRYQGLLENEDDPLHDAEGLMWHAVSELEKPQSRMPAEIFFSYGFHSFNRVQLRLLDVIANRASEVFVHLHHDPTRPEAFAASGRALTALRETLQCEPRSAAPAVEVGDIGHVAANLFRPEAGTRPPDGSLVFLEAGSPGLEADEVAREIHHLVAEGRACYSEIAVICRGRETRDRFAQTLARHRLPVRNRKQPLGASAAGRCLLLCLQIIREDWPASAVGALLKSPCLRGAATERARAEVNAWQQGVREGRSPWFEEWPDDDTLQARTAALAAVRELEDRLRQAKEPGEIAAALRSLVEGFVHPDDEGGPTISSGPPRSRRTGPGGGEAADDDPDARLKLAAARRDDDAARRKLDGLIREIEFIARQAAAGPAGRRRPGRPPARQPLGSGWRAFCEELERAIAGSSYDPGPRRFEGVNLLDARRLGGETYRVVFIVNLLEKVFPEQVREDPFLRDRDRRLLAQAHPRVNLELARDRQEEEGLLFWRAVSCARERLYLSYPVADEEAKESLPSFYVTEVQRLFDPAPEPRRRSFSDLAPSPARAVSAPDWAACILHGLARDLPAEQQARPAAHYNAWLGCAHARPDRCLHPAPDYAAVLACPELLAALEKRDRPYSPSELETYLACPYLYYCDHLLDLRPVRREIAPLDYGLLLHDVLARLYGGLCERAGRPVDAAALDPGEVVALALKLLDECLAGQPRFAHLPAAQRDIERQRLGAILTRFVRADLEATAERGLRPARFELAFGGSGASRSRRKALDLGEMDGRPVLMSGRIDRVDLAPDDAVVIVDYKFGKTLPDIRGVSEGLVLQAPLYAMAAGAILGAEVAGAEYASIKSGKRAGIHRHADLAPERSVRNLVLPGEDFDSALAVAASAARECVARIRRGEIPRGPREDHCPSWCGYRGICRVDAWTLRRIQAQRGRA